jgi:serine/threonine protein phosphatase PrpC
VEVAVKTHIGYVRQVNEDSADIFTRDHLVTLAVVADGMGGHQAGDVASQMTLRHLKDSFAVVDLNKSIGEWEEWLLQTIDEANLEIYQYAIQNDSFQGMGTTIVATLLLEHEYIIAHVGDSRIYRYYNNQLESLTEDHSFVNELLKSGQITAVEAAFHPQRNVITRALGTEEDVEIDIKTLSFLGGEQLLLCSDGLTGMVSQQQLQEVLSTKKMIEEKATSLVKLALDAGGEDNISLILLELEDDELGEE